MADIATLKGNRLALHEILVGILGSNNVYYQPPEDLKLKYPAILYERSTINTRYANNAVYSLDYLYSLTIIDSNPNSNIVDAISKLPGSRFDRHYASGGFNHDVFTIYFKGGI